MSTSESDPRRHVGVHLFQATDAAAEAVLGALRAAFPPCPDHGSGTVAPSEDPDLPGVRFCCVDATRPLVKTGSPSAPLAPAGAGSVSLQLRAQDSQAVVDVAYELMGLFQGIRQERYVDGQGVAVLPMVINPEVPGRA